MRKVLTAFLLLMFVCALPLQAYAQGCAAHCASMQTDAPAESDGSPCTQVGTCELATCIQLSVLPSSVTGTVSAGSFSLTASIEKFFPDRALSPLDRPPISS